MGKQVIVACKSDVGMVRHENQDHYGVLDPGETDAVARRGILVVVADGMGGHTGGVIASHTTVDTILEVFADLEPRTMRAMVDESIKASNDAVRAKAEADPKLRDMGTTCVALHVRGPQVLVGHLGDSRCYLIRDERLEQVTRDHTYLNELIDMGLLTPEQAEGHPDRNIITRCVGMAQQLEIDFNRRTTRDGDCYLLCSDGLTNMVNDAEILEHTISYEPEEACDRLVKLANERGGDDNITVAIVKIKETPEVDGDLLALDERDSEVTPSLTPVVKREDVDRFEEEQTTRQQTQAFPIAEDLEETKKDITAEVQQLEQSDREQTRENPQSDGDDPPTHPAWFWIIGIEILILVALQFWISRL